MEKSHHFLILCYPVQGHINPTLQLAKQLTRGGASVTFATTVHGLTSIKSFPTHPRLSYASFSDGRDDGPNSRQDSTDNTLATAEQVGSTTLSDLLNRLSTDGNPATMIIYSIILPWAAAVARDFNLPSAFFFSQSATTFVLYQKYFQLNFIPEISSIKIPGLLPSFSSEDIPTILLPTGKFHFLTSILKQHIQIVEQDPDSVVLINTFNALEEESIDAIDNVKMIPIGPLIPSAFSDETEPSDRSYGVDLFVESKSESHDYLKWLDTKQSKSVIYVSFGSLATLKKRQVEEVMNGLIDSNREFLWVMRSVDSEDEGIKSMVGDHGLVVPWCCQVEVLSHGSVGCFVTHCGWNSTTESIIAGVPVVACPQFSDQVTNAKMVEEVWRVGVKAVAAPVPDDEIEMVVGREEIKRCLEIVMGSGERGIEIRRNVGKWRDLALDAVKEGGSSHKNLKEFLRRN